MHVFIDRKYSLIDFLSLPIYCVRFKRNIQSLPAMIAGISHIADDINVQRQIILDKAEWREQNILKRFCSSTFFIVNYISYLGFYG